MNYIALIRKDADSDFGVEFPDFPGCISAGSTLEEALAMGREALSGHIRWMVAEGDPIPEPSSLERIRSTCDMEGALAAVVSTLDPRGKARRVNMTIPDSVLVQIDAYARRAGMSRSEFLVKSALGAMGNVQGK